jgi:integrase
MKIGDIDKSESVWKYVPLAHKTAHHGHHRVILIGPKAQAVLQPFLMKLDPQAHVFSPADSMAEIRQRRSEARVTPLSEGNRPGINRVRNPKRLPRDHYTPDTYNGAISRACELAFQPPPPLCKQERESYRRWMLRLTEDEKAELRKWQKEHHWFANQLRHTAATSLRAKFGLEAAQVILGHRNANITQVYAERDVEAGKRIVAAIG